jgi:hypothetical protein
MDVEARVSRVRGDYWGVRWGSKGGERGGRRGFRTGGHILQVKHAASCTIGVDVEVIGGGSFLKLRQLHMAV